MKMTQYSILSAYVYAYLIEMIQPKIVIFGFEENKNDD